jgi:hypothetical protein
MCGVTVVRRGTEISMRPEWAWVTAMLLKARPSV